MFDYETMRLIWWALLGILLIGIAVMDGFDFGVAILLPFVARSDVERRIVINTVGPVWEGNQVWLILDGGAIFAAWPLLYATAFSGFYLAMFLVLAALILRPVAFKFRSKLDDVRWRATWDVAFFVAGLVPALIFGVAFGNVIVGVPFRFDDTLRMTYEGTLLGLLNPFALVCGLISVAMLTLHGANYLALKAEGPLVARGMRIGRMAALAAVALFIVAGIWVAYGIEGYSIAQPIPHDGPSNPLLKTVTKEAGAWPFMLPSSLDPSASLTVWDTSSSLLTLRIMLAATVIFLPMIMLYTAWVYNVLRGPINEAFVKDDRHSTVY
ncbi:MULTISPECIES: cytochrome d ubiquinol oxidase subunit II [Bradyrhizobium]|uniref:cytochrome d ubiquinol oxidase subunit II n=1 Tax=Bradyrhizobium TaxID=374 RepID=UPI000420E1CC|nr:MULTISPECIES: cytochrome d ubiquinol oxidase subunit II [Bradyrhizobium]WLB87931.1 cytochrome d ubiquinol oxidase subunit II [Bradyrhizobium japonicum USDA 135]GLR94218.1 cytochrome d ubiquinol oxidase subunit II [Bradyrhizobium liaoningense]